MRKALDGIMVAVMLAAALWALGPVGPILVALGTALGSED